MFNTPHRFSLVRARRRHTGRTARVGKLKLNDQVLFAMGYNGRGVALARLLGHMLADLSAGQGSKLGPLASSLEPIPFHALRVPAK
jgi:glycine/D-amino acid oxidase-like deaminating enzyme